MYKNTELHFVTIGALVLTVSLFINGCGSNSNGADAQTAADSRSSAEGTATESTPLTWGEIVRDSEGHIRPMNQYDAAAYCLSVDMRLPTARELIELGRMIGEFEIRETAYPNMSAETPAVSSEIQRMFPIFTSNTQFIPVFRFNEAHVPSIDFYVQHSNPDYPRYSDQMPDGVYSWYWSSSIDPTNDSKAYGLYVRGTILSACRRYSRFVFEESAGDSSSIAVRCVRGGGTR